MTGLYVSTTTAGNWQDRIVAQGLGRRAAGAVRLSAEGVCIEREGESDIFVPAADLVAVGTAPGIAGKVMGMADGVLIIRWSLGDATLDSGFRADDDELQADFSRLQAHLQRGRTATPPAHDRCRHERLAQYQRSTLMSVSAPFPPCWSSRTAGSTPAPSSAPPERPSARRFSPPG